MWRIRQSNDQRPILVAIDGRGSAKALMGVSPAPDCLRYEQTTYFQYEMEQALDSFRTHGLAAAVTTVVHFAMGVNPILLLQLFLTPYNLMDNGLVRKWMIGCDGNTRVWGEKFAGEVPEDRIQAYEDGPIGRELQPVIDMAKDLEDKVLDAWDDGSKGNLRLAVEAVGPISVNSQTIKNRWSLLMVACALPQTTEEELSHLMDLGASVNLVDDEGWTALHWGAQHGRDEAVTIVVEHLAKEKGAEALAEILSIRDAQGYTALQVAENAGNSSHTKLMNALGSDNDGADALGLD
ncbi:unnamed protein product [Chrysoparadoxa australica]